MVNDPTQVVKKAEWKRREEGNERINSKANHGEWRSLNNLNSEIQKRR
jgi:hypothetical protein